MGPYYYYYCYYCDRYDGVPIKSCSHAPLVAAHLVTAHLVAAPLVAAHLVATHVVAAHLVATHVVTAHLVATHLVATHVVATPLVTDHIVATPHENPCLQTKCKTAFKLVKLKLKCFSNTSTRLFPTPSFSRHDHRFCFNFHPRSTAPLVDV